MRLSWREGVEGVESGFNVFSNMILFPHAFDVISNKVKIMRLGKRGKNFVCVID